MLRLAPVALGLLLIVPFAAFAQRAQTARAADYFPARWDWQHRSAKDAGMQATAVDDAVRFAVASETPSTKDLAINLATSFGAREPFDAPIGPVKPRGPASGLVTRHGYIVAEWGEPARVDMTFSVTKTFLSTVVGLAWARGLIHDVKDYTRDYMPPGVDLFEAPHNQKITWDDLLRQTSDWQGTLWGKPDWADRPEGDKPSEWPNRKLWDPGTHYKYNDVRVNVLALAALHVWRRPLPEVLREYVMEPIGASSTWRWYGYDNSWVEIDGQRMQSMTGGGHWGGGMLINAFEMARFGYLFLRNGRWGDREIVPPTWIQMARTPGRANPDYGFCNWFLNARRASLPSAPESSVTFRGNGQNIIYVDWDHDIVAVVRWIGSDAQVDEFIRRMLVGIDA
jgi:CubicO group peptidase (beta-lactamase class C family)